MIDQQPSDEYLSFAITGAAEPGVVFTPWPRRRDQADIVTLARAQLTAAEYPNGSSIKKIARAGSRSGSVGDLRIVCAALSSAFSPTPMSWKASGYVRKLRTTRRTGRRLTRTEKFVLLVLADHYDEARGDAWAPLKRLATDCLISKQGLVTTLKALEAEDMVAISRGPHTKRGFPPNRYRLPGYSPDAPTGGEDSQPASPEGSQASGPRVVKPGLTTLGQASCPNPKDEEPKKNDPPVVPPRGDTARACGSRGEGKKQDTEPMTRFETFWTNAPARNGKKVLKAKARTLFLRLTEAEQIDCIAATKPYARHCVATGQLPRDPHRFLRDGHGGELWRDFVPAEPKQAPPQRLAAALREGEPMPDEVRAQLRKSRAGAMVLAIAVRAAGDREAEP